MATAAREDNQATHLRPRFWRGGRIAFYALAAPLILVMAWFALFCVNVARGYSNVDTDWILSKEPQELGWPMKEADRLLLLKVGDKLPYPGYVEPAESPRIVPHDVLSEIRTTIEFRIQASQTPPENKERNYWP